MNQRESIVLAVAAVLIGFILGSAVSAVTTPGVSVYTISMCDALCADDALDAVEPGHPALCVCRSGSRFTAPEAR